MSRRQKSHLEKHGPEEIGLYTIVTTSGTDQRLSCENTMLIYDEDVDTMLDELGEWDSEEDDNWSNSSYGDTLPAVPDPVVTIKTQFTDEPKRRHVVADKRPDDGIDVNRIRLDRIASRSGEGTEDDASQGNSTEEEPEQWYDSPMKRSVSGIREVEAYQRMDPGKREATEDDATYSSAVEEPERKIHVRHGIHMPGEIAEHDKSRSPFYSKNHIGMIHEKDEPKPQPPSGLPPPQQPQAIRPIQLPASPDLAEAEHDLPRPPPPPPPPPPPLKGTAQMGSGLSRTHVQVKPKKMHRAASLSKATKPNDGSNFMTGQSIRGQLPSLSTRHPGKFGDKPRPMLSSARTPMSAPLPTSRHHRSSKDENISKILSRLKEGKSGEDYVFEMLVRSVKLKKDDATRTILAALEKGKENLSDQKFREKKSTASLLHIALLFQRHELCLKLVGKYPGLVKVKYVSEDFRNQTVFHIAAANDTYGIVIHKMLKTLDNMQRSALLNTVADGTYFMNERPEAATCLSAAVWTGNHNLIRLFVDYGADLSLRGMNGNTLLHYVIYLSATSLSLEKAKACITTVFECCDTWWALQKGLPCRSAEHNESIRFDALCSLLNMRNDAGLIPVALAVNLHSPLTPFLLGVEPVNRRIQQKYGASAWATYDVTDILSYQPWEHSRQYNCNSVLHVLAHTRRILTTDDGCLKRSDIAELEPINSVIKMKWSLFRYMYAFWLLIHAAYMITLTSTALVLHRTESKNRLTIFNVTSSTSYTTNGTEEEYTRKMTTNALFSLFLVIPIFYVIFEVIDLVVSLRGFCYIDYTNVGPKRGRGRVTNYLMNHCTITGNAPYRLLAIGFSICMFVWYGMYLSEDISCDVPLSLALILGWIFMLNFTRACPHVCRFSIMIQKMFFRDFLYFITVYMFILIAFSSALHLILPPDRSVGNTVMDLLNIVTNVGGEDEDGKAKPANKHYAEAVFSMYAIFSVILLLNMLIAMMNTSYEAVKSSRTNLWRYQQLSILLMLERRFIWWKWLCAKSQADTKRELVTKSAAGNLHRVYLDVTEEKMKV